MCVKKRQVWARWKPRLGVRDTTALSMAEGGEGGVGVVWVCELCVLFRLCGPHCCTGALPGCGQRGCSLAAVQGLLIAGASPAAEHGLPGAQASVAAAAGLWCTGSVVVAHRLSCSAACGIFPDQGSNPCLLHWQADFFFFFFYHWAIREPLNRYFIFLIGVKLLYTVVLVSFVYTVGDSLEPGRAKWGVWASRNTPPDAGFPGGSVVSELPETQGPWARSLGREGPLLKGMATHSRILTWRIPRREEPGGLQPMGSQRVWYDWATEQQQSVSSPPNLSLPSSPLVAIGLIFTSLTLLLFCK